jgi:hypothetical protein
LNRILSFNIFFYLLFEEYREYDKLVVWDENILQKYTKLAWENISYNQYLEYQNYSQEQSKWDRVKTAIDETHIKTIFNDYSQPLRFIKPVSFYINTNVI